MINFPNKMSSFLPFVNLAVLSRNRETFERGIILFKFKIQIEIRHTKLHQKLIIENLKKKLTIVKSFFSRHIVNTFLLIYQLGTCCVYVVFVASNIKAIADPLMEEPIDVRMYMLIILLPLILINWVNIFVISNYQKLNMLLTKVRNLKYLAPFSTFANAITMVSFGIICYYLFREPISFKEKDAFGSAKEFPLFFGTVLFALEAIGVVSLQSNLKQPTKYSSFQILPLENEMKTPKSFGGSFGVLNKAMVLIVFLYVGMGFFGYLNYGHIVEGSITLNLPETEL